MTTEFTLIDLFAGCGGMTCGFTRAGTASAAFVPVAAVEHDFEAAATYAANFGDHVFAGDIAHWPRRNIPKADVVIGGPPCQGFSALGTRNPSDPRNSLWSQYVSVVAHARPSYFVLENVPEFLRSEQYASLERKTRARSVLADYELEPYVLVASDHGAAQRRKRAIVIGRLRGLPPVGEPRRRAARTVREVLSGIDVYVPPQRVRLPARTHRFQDMQLPGLYRTSELHVTRTFTALSYKRFAAIPEGGNRRDIPTRLLPECWKRHTTGTGDVMGRLRWDQPSVTIRTEFFKPEKGRYLHPTADRSITHREAAALQGFPTDYLWSGSKTSIARQIGNAVPVELGSAIAERILDVLVNGAGDSEAA